ncbi:Type I restriction-modification system, specificity subunit S [Levilactobacillus brevis]|uniref:restriction endonuclease subunit S n=1 Tax=Levilactobacillus brevis TaxID=1580 RepID=UPI00057DA43E|nr:restriction endonuclease subunit S [Levilactobacillus brevis]KID43118.1 Type I restriction-modification system, specificity subunit S [Levilactobacillus brevis]
MKDNQAKYPQLRFKGFTDPWEERKLSSISERVTRKNKNNESTLPLTISAQDGLVDQNDFFNKQVASRDVTGYFLVKNGEFAYNKSYSNGYPWGAIKRLDKYDMGVLSTLYIVFRPTKINSQFLVSYYDTTRWYREVSKNAAEGARNHGLLNIAPTDFFNTLLVVPKIVDEQQKIGSFFKQLDDTIALHQRKLAKLKELKQGYLQKLFPKNGSKFPQLRFAGFADAWEQRKLTEIVNRVNKSSNSDVLPKVEFEDIVSGEGRLNKDISSKLDSRKGTLFESENILYGKLRPYLKNWLFPDFEGVALGDFWVFEATDVSVPSFDYYLIQSDDYQKVANDTSGTKMPRSDWKNVSSTDFAIPSKDEQKQIGTFFKQLDNTITLHQRKLEKLQELKKGYLQKMFC